MILFYIHQFYYLKLGLAAVLVAVGAKMVVTDLYHIPSWLSLLVLAFILTIVIVASLVCARGLSPAVHKEASEAVPATTKGDSEGSSAQ